MTAIRMMVGIVTKLPRRLSKPFILFSLEVVSSISKLSSAELLALSFVGEVGKDASQLLFDLGMRKSDAEYSGAPKPPPNGSTVRVLSGPHEGRLATVGISDITPTAVSVWVQFPDKKMATLDSAEVKEITPPEWQPIGADNTPEIGSLLWGPSVKQDRADGAALRAGPCLIVFDGSKTLDALMEDGYSKWLSTVTDLHEGGSFVLGDQGSA
jgi:hypothetical protein